MTLPGMPVRIGDPGVFVCGPRDIAPWESAPARGRKRAPAPAIAPDHGRAWLVLGMCPRCNPVTGRYCTDHDANNWWLTTMASSGRKETRRARPLDAGVSARSLSSARKT